MATKITLKDVDAFSNDYQAEALKILNKARPNQIAENIQTALLFPNNYKNVLLLEVLGPQHIDLALTDMSSYWGDDFDYGILKAAKVLKDSENLHLLLRFGFVYTAEALEILGADKAGCALHFSTRAKLEVLKLAMPNFDCGIVEEPVAPTGEQSDTEGGSL